MSADAITAEQGRQLLASALKSQNLTLTVLVAVLQSHAHGTATRSAEPVAVMDTNAVLAKIAVYCNSKKRLMRLCSRVFKVYRLCSKSAKKILHSGHTVLSPMPRLTDPERMHLRLSGPEEIEFRARVCCLESGLPLRKTNISSQTARATKQWKELQKERRGTAVKAAEEKAARAKVQKDTELLAEAEKKQRKAKAAGLAQARASAAEASAVAKASSKRPRPKSPAGDGSADPQAAGDLHASAKVPRLLLSSSTSKQVAKGSQPETAASTSASPSTTAKPGETKESEHVSAAADSSLAAPPALPAGGARAAPSPQVAGAAPKACASRGATPTPMSLTLSSKAEAVKNMDDALSGSHSVLMPKSISDPEKAVMGTDSSHALSLGSDSDEGEESEGGGMACVRRGHGFMKEEKVRRAPPTPTSAEDEAFIFDSGGSGEDDELYEAATAAASKESSDSDSGSGSVHFSDSEPGAIAAARARVGVSDSESDEEGDTKYYRKQEARAIEARESAKAKAEKGSAKPKRRMEPAEQSKLDSGLSVEGSVRSEDSEPISLYSLPGDPKLTILPCGNRKWKSLSKEQQSWALILGFSADKDHRMHWDTIRRAWRAGQAYLPNSFAHRMLTELSKEKQRAMRGLGILSAAYECLSANGVIANNARTWERLSTNAKKAARVLGFQLRGKAKTHRWNFLDPAGKESFWLQFVLFKRKWKHLRQTQKEAASTLDWTEASWNVLVKNIIEASKFRDHERIQLDREKAKAAIKAVEEKAEGLRRRKKSTRKMKPAPQPVSSSSDSDSDSSDSNKEGLHDSDYHSDSGEEEADLGAESESPTLSEEETVESKKSYLKRKAKAQAEEKEAAKNAAGELLEKPATSEEEDVKPKGKKSKPKTPASVSPDKPEPPSPAPSATSMQSEKELQNDKQGFVDNVFERMALGLTMATGYASLVPKSWVGKGTSFYAAAEKSSALLAHQNRLLNQPFHLPARTSTKKLINPTTLWLLPLWMPAGEAWVAQASKKVMVLGAGGVLEDGSSDTKLSDVHFHVKSQFIQAIQARMMAMLKCPVTTCQGFVSKSQMGPWLEYCLWLQQLSDKYYLEGICLLDKTLMEWRSWGTWDFTETAKAQEALREFADQQLPQQEKHCVYCAGDGHTIDNCRARTMPKELPTAVRGYTPAGTVCKHFNIGSCHSGANCSMVRWPKF